MRFALLVSIVTLSLAGCAETFTCPAGEGIPPGSGVCRPLCETASGQPGFVPPRMTECRAYAQMDGATPPVDGGEDDGGPDAGDSGDAGETACDGGCDAAHCIGGACVTCTPATAAADCTAAARPLCVNNECIGCVSDESCENVDAPICGDNDVCRACTSDLDCEGHPGTTTCDEGTGRCEQCTFDDEDACGTNVCDVEARVCTTRVAGSAGLCETCVSDRECAMGQVCVPDRFAGAEVGYVCAWQESAIGVGAPNGACSTVPPYRSSRSEISLGDEVGPVCVLSVSTCEAHADFARQSCGTGIDLSGGPVAEGSCGAMDAADGFCARFDAALNQCTVECAVFQDCPCQGGTCTRRYACDDGFCSLNETCLVATGVCTI